MYNTMHAGYETRRSQPPAAAAAAASPELLYRLADRLTAAAQPLYMQLLLPVSQHKAGALQGSSRITQLLCWALVLCQYLLACCTVMSAGPLLAHHTADAWKHCYS
jgi:hypothetical protein